MRNDRERSSLLRDGVVRPKSQRIEGADCQWRSAFALNAPRLAGAGQVDCADGSLGPDAEVPDVHCGISCDRKRNWHFGFSGHLSASDASDAVRGVIVLSCCKSRTALYRTAGESSTTNDRLKKMASAKSFYSKVDWLRS